jgi:hypothetical protein
LIDWFRSTRPRGLACTLGIVIVLCPSLVVPARAQAEAAPPGSAEPLPVRVKWSNNRGDFELRGSALAFERDTLALVPADSLAQIRVAFANLSRVEVRSESKGNALAGLLIGAIAGGILGAIAQKGYEDDPFTGEPSNDAAPVWSVMGGAAVGGLIGAGIGALVRTGGWRRVDRQELAARLAAGSRVQPARP